jgi:hypothetical protein
MKRTLIAAAVLVSISAHADPGGNGTSAASWGGSIGNGTAQLGYFPNWQTASPEKRAQFQNQMPKLPSAPSQGPQWPAWVKLAN